MCVTIPSGRNKQIIRGLISLHGQYMCIFKCIFYGIWITQSSKCARRAHLELVSPACVHPTASSKWARRAHLELVSLACVHPTASSKWARRAHLELVSLACVHHCHICCPNSSSKYAWKCSRNSNKYWMANSLLNMSTL